MMTSENKEEIFQAFLEVNLQKRDIHQWVHCHALEHRSEFTLFV